MSDISKSEFEVLDVLWEKYPASASDIVDRLNLSKPWHEKTVKTLLSRLVKKQAIDFKKESRSYFYFPLLERDAYVAKESQSFVGRMFDGKIAPLVAGFAKSDNLTQEDIDQLKTLIANWEQHND